MPNHVMNELFFTCDNEERIEELLNTIKNDEEAIDFEKIIPMPNNIFRGNLGYDERCKYGKNNWYDWSIANWGTKWNAYDTSSDYEHVSFFTAWSAPDPVVRRLSEMFPDVHIQHFFADENIGYNCGKIEYENGTGTDVTEFDEGSVEADKFACDMWGYDYEEYIEECRG